jgi:hypothetical protein
MGGGGFLFVFHDDGESIKFPYLARDDGRFGINPFDERNHPGSRADQFLPERSRRKC